MVADNEERQEVILKLRFAGLTYKQIAQRLSTSRQRVHQLIAPPPSVRNEVVRRANGKCQDCSLQVNGSGHVHHISCYGEDYNDLANLRLLCGSCHHKAHFPSNGKKPQTHIIGRPKGSKTKKPNAYAGRSDRVRAKHGKKCYRRWGKKGGNPALLKLKHLPEIQKEGNNNSTAQRISINEEGE